MDYYDYANQWFSPQRMRPIPRPGFPTRTVMEQTPYPMPTWMDSMRSPGQPVVNAPPMMQTPKPPSFNLGPARPPQPGEPRMGFNDPIIGALPKSKKPATPRMPYVAPEAPSGPQRKMKGPAMRRPMQDYYAMAASARG